GRGGVFAERRGRAGAAGARLLRRSSARAERGCEHHDQDNNQRAFGHQVPILSCAWPGSGSVGRDALPTGSLSPLRPGEQGERTMAVKRVGIVGSGIMGSGIAEVAAKAGCEVILRSRAQSTADAMVAGLEKSLAKQVDRGKLDAGERDAV